VPLQTKVGIAFGVMIVLMVAHGGYNIARQRAIMHEESRERASVLVSTLTEMAAESLVTRHFDRLERQVDSLLTHSDVRFARVIDNSGRIVADTNRERQGWVLTHTNDLTRRYRETGADLILEQPITIASGGETRVFGRAEVGLSLQRAQERSQRTTMILLIVLLVQVAVGVVFGTYLHLQVVNPLDAIVYAVESLAPGVEGEKIPYPRRAAGEIVTVTKAINTMRSRLEHFHREEHERQRLRTLGEISVSLAHEIRNPLEAVSGAVEVLRRIHGTGDEHLQFLDIIHEEVANLNHYVSEFLRYGRFDIPDEKIWDLRILAEDAVLLVSPLSSQRKILLTVQQESPSVPVHVSGDQVKRVLVNLLMNAVEACSEGNEIVVSIDRVDGMGLVHVDDNGPGISQSIKQDLFAPFVTTKDHGAGLGLAICKTVIDHHGGDLTVEDGRGGGVRASITLPVCDSTQDGYDMHRKDVTR
jgi:signal transduction histidine kinase